MKTPFVKNNINKYFLVVTFLGLAVGGCSSSSDSTPPAPTVTTINGQHIIDSSLGIIPFDGIHQGSITLLVRPDSAVINGTGGLSLHGIIIEKTFLGNLCHVTIMANGTRLKFYFLASSKIPQVDENIQFTINTEGIIPIFESPINHE